MPKPGETDAHDPPMEEEEEEEEVGESTGDEGRASSEAEEEEKEKEVSKPKPSEEQISQVKKKNSAVASSGRKTSEGKFPNSKKPFDRLWSEDDEIVLLQGMIDYREKNKVDPKTQLDDFFEFIKKSVQVDVSKSQLRNKIRNLKRKYDKWEKKVSLKEGYEKIAFDLLKRIWGTESDSTDHKVGRLSKANKISLKRCKDSSREDAVVFQPHAKRSMLNVEPQSAFINGFENSGIENWIQKFGMTVIKGEKREEIEEKWREFQVQEAEVYAEKLEMLIKQGKMVLEAMKASGC